MRLFCFRFCIFPGGLLYAFLCSLITLLVIFGRVDESLLALRDTINSASYDAERMQKSLFERLSPLLILKILPLRVFNDFNSSILYGQLLNQDSMHGTVSRFLRHLS